MTDSPLRDHDREVGDDPPPFLGSWARVYLAVVMYLAVVIVLFYVFGAAFSP